jgi:Peptidase family M1 domain
MKNLHDNLLYFIQFVHNRCGETATATLFARYPHCITLNVHAYCLPLILDVALKSVKFYKEFFGVAYTLPKMDIVAVPDFYIGAMENWGLLTFR